MEILAEKPCTAKLHANPRFKAQKLENVAHGLQFCWDCGVTMTLKPSPENLIDGDQPAVLGLIWALVCRGAGMNGGACEEGVDYS